MSGYVAQILISKVKGQPSESVNRVKALVEQGLEGDRFCDGSDRQISILAEDVNRWMSEQEVQGLCFRRYKANILVDDAEVSQWKSGDHLKVGEAILAVTVMEKECFPECRRHSRGLECRLQGGCCYARVLETGTIMVGDKISNDIE